MAADQVPDIDPSDDRQAQAGPVQSKIRPVVLIVDDANLLRHVIATVLNAHGYDSLLARNGQDALEKATIHTVDLVTMDIDMPFMDGIEATRRIRALGGWRASVPIIGFSSRDDREDHRCCRDAGMNTLVSKGAGLDVLLEVIQQLVPTISVGIER